MESKEEGIHVHWRPCGHGRWDREPTGAHDRYTLSIVLIETSAAKEREVDCLKL